MKTKKRTIKKAPKKAIVKAKKKKAIRKVKRRVYYRLPSIIVELGKALEIGLTSGRSIKFRDAFLLGANVAGDRLFVLPVKRQISRSAAKRPAADQAALISQARKLYRRFTDFESSKSYKMKLTDHILKKLGNAAFIAYRSDKWSGKKVDYIHHFEAITELWADDENEKAARIFAMRGSIGVKREGITG